MRILIVDDNKENLYLLESMLKGIGYEVVLAGNGAEALEKLRTKSVDMIISDVLMPVMDGFKLCKEVKGIDELKNIPFIFYTATYKDERDEKFALKLGADKYILKPAEPEKLIKIIQGVIRDVEEGKFEPKEPALAEEKEVFKLYSERLVNKLEKKMLDLEKEITVRTQTEEALKKAQDELELKVDERTKELMQANLRLKELDRLKSKFIASMSHELKTPLNSIIGLTGIILQGISGEITEVQRKELTMVKNSADHLFTLISNIIDVSKIEADQIELAIEELDLAELIQGVRDSFKTSVDEKGLKMSLKTPERLIIKGDSRRAKQVIINLVSNAVKFTDKGEIAINAAKKDKGVEVSVADTGIGIKKENMKKLFKQFSRIHIAGRLVVEGTGLGLYLSKKIADLLGGEIKVKSEFGKGSKFTFILPLKYKGAKK
jgi:hypothetical protein